MTHGNHKSPFAIPNRSRIMFALVCVPLGLFFLVPNSFGQFQIAQAYAAPGFP